MRLQDLTSLPDSINLDGVRNKTSKPKSLSQTIHVLMGILRSYFLAVVLDKIDNISSNQAITSILWR